MAARRSLEFRGSATLDSRKMLIKCPDRMKSTDYVKIQDIFDQKLNLRRLTFHQDNARVHKAHIVEYYFRCHGVNVLKRLPCNPDLNIIENM